MHKIAILVKTYAGDLPYVERLMPSLRQHNADRIPVYLVAPSRDLEHFRKFVCDGVELLSDESVSRCLAREPVAGIRPGYINQEIVKLAFWETGLCENYFCVDSDGEFIRDFYVADLMYDDDTPYTILAEDNELVVEPQYYAEYWAGREKCVRLIQKEVGLEDRRMLTCHAFAIFSAKVLRAFHEKFLVPRNLTYLDILAKSPYEFSWYNMWLQKDKTIPIQFREPLFKFFHHKNQHIEYLLRNVTLADLARGYIGVNINSNFSRGVGMIDFAAADNRLKLLAKYFTVRELLFLFAYGLTEKIPRYANLFQLWLRGRYPPA